jgi:hypothetical protein
VGTRIDIYRRLLARLRQSLSRGSPFGGEAWMTQTAAQLGPEFTLRGPGRPRKKEPTGDTTGDEASLFGEQ